MRDHYTQYPRPILWLIPEGKLRGEVEIEPFYLSKFPVTNEQFEAFDPGYLRSPVSLGDRDPAVGVSWQAAVDYCAWYAEVADKAIRLPTEEEWEWACRGETTGRFFFDDEADSDRYLWDAEGSAELGGEAVPKLDDKTANVHGLFGVLGGVWEWVDGEEDGQHVARGGSFRTPRSELSVDSRLLVEQGKEPDDVGFRIARSLR